MPTVRWYHNLAMELAEESIVERHNGNHQAAMELARRAYDHEIKAASLLAAVKNSEPTRSILYRSAATLAYQADEPTFALRAIADGLSGFPPNEIRDELNALHDEIVSGGSSPV